MGGGAAAGGFAQFLGSAMQADATESAARMQQSSAKDAQNQQWSMYQQQRQDAAPWRNTGGAAMQQLGWLLGLGGQGGGAMSSDGGSLGGWVDKDGNVAYAPGLDLTAQRGLQNGTGGSSPFGFSWFKKNGHPIPADKLGDLKFQQEQYAQIMKEKGYSPAGGGQGVGASSGFQGNPNDFGSFSRSFGMSDFQADPGYQFRMDEAMKALNRSAASRGQLFSGGTLKDLQGYSQGLASQEYGNAYNRFNNDRSQRFNQLAALAGIGQTANGQLMQGGMNAVNNMSNAALQAGNAASAGAAAQGNIWGNFANNMGNYWQQWAQMNQGNNSGGGGMPNWSNGSGGWGNSGDIRDNENGGWWD